jgi:hypothetical protein
VEKAEFNLVPEAGERKFSGPTLGKSGLGSKGSQIMVITQQRCASVPLIHWLSTRAGSTTIPLKSIDGYLDE